MDRFKRAYRAFEDYFAGGLLFTGLTLVFVNVCLRYIWGRPQSVLDEFSVYFVVWGTLCGIAVALRDDHHIKVDMVFRLLPLGIRRSVSILAHCIGLSFALFYTYYGYQLVDKYIKIGQLSMNSQFPLWIVNLVMPISGVMFTVRFLDRLYFHFKNGGKDWLAAQLGKERSAADGDSVAF
ncbi:TRAP transporter small permease subunit [Desulfofundulus thermobenzoicus]|uniref:TRAP transporter small permease subunit n=1 Tax=Desulfofundulus thermobenzoicus TaxID=29376 RepID=A0A6N7IS54_9FIRM|nr:TRAP transporter small permease [Desulfofundulus thermobenzoicus]MQL52383.1 TRAP transporter small permease subunit [Desulfofundulus thermobenzoicus]HHW43127.1 TRAP transporter small permease [Desulfotomaculum sp.]